MQREIQINYTDDLVRSGTKRFLDRQLGLRTTILLLGLIGGGGLLLYSPPFNDLWLSGAVIGMWVVVTVLIVGFRLYIPRIRLAAIRKLPHRDFTLSFTDEHLGITGPLGHNNMPWNTIGKLWRFPDVWLLIYCGGGFTTLPTDLLEQDLQAWLVEIIKQHGGKVR